MRITEIVDTVFRDTKFPLIHKSPTVLDDNAMIRLTSVGPQIVFVDPISYVG